MENQILDSRYKIIQSLGKGGFGKTYLAEDTKRPNNPICVVKQLNPGIDDPKFLEMARRLFSKESETLEKLGVHDRIPRLLANFEQENEFYLVQEYVEGQTLSQELVPGEPWSEEKVIAFLKDCLQIVDFVHSNGVIHRDVKPDNLIRRSQDRKLVLVDFGTVKEVVLSQTQAIASTVAVGTRGYMPTEQARGKPRFTSDIYALGIIAVQALTGVHPIQLQEDENGEIIWQAQAQCSPKLKEIISKMVRYHFKDRYQSAKDVAESLVVFERNALEIPATQAVRYTPTAKLKSDTGLNNVASIDSTLNISSDSPGTNFESAKQPELDRSKSHDLSHESAVVPNADLSESDSVLPSQQDIPTQIPLANNVKSKLDNFIKSPTAITLGVALLIGAIASGGMSLLSSNTANKQQATIASTLEEIEAHYDAKDYAKCSAQIQDKTTKEINIPQSEVNKWIGKCELGKAQKEAATEEYENAINIAIKISEDEFPNHQQVREQIDTWSEKVLQQATKVYTQEGDLKEAKKMIVNVIPQSSAVKIQALDLKAQWEKEYQINQPIIESAQKALRDNRWEGAKTEASKIANNSSEYWQLQVRDILEEANKEIQSAQKQTPSSPASSNSSTFNPPQSNPTSSTTQTAPPKRQTGGTNTNTVKTNIRKVIPPKPEPPAVIDICRDAPDLC